MAKRSKKIKQPENEIKTEVVYALRHIESGTLLIMEKSSNDGADFCNDCTVRLQQAYGDEPGDWNPDTWYIDTAMNAEFVRQYPTEWYNSCERTPKHHFKPEDLEVVQIERIIKTMQIKAKVPTFEEYIELKYRDREPDHADYVLKKFKDSPRSFGTSPYSLWELMMLAENGKWNPEGDNDG